MSRVRADHRSESIREEDDRALSRADEDGFVVRRSVKHHADVIHARRCHERNLPCVCVHQSVRVADVMLEMPAGVAGWTLTQAAQREVISLLVETPCAAHAVGPRRVVACGVSIYEAGELARCLYDIASGCSPEGRPR